MSLRRALSLYCNLAFLSGQNSDGGRQPEERGANRFEETGYHGGSECYSFSIWNNVSLQACCEIGIDEQKHRQSG